MKAKAGKRIVKVVSASSTGKDLDAVELFRLRYVLREAIANGKKSNAVDRALSRMFELGTQGRGDLLFEYQRWNVQLESH